MIVVADAGPMQYLVRIGAVDVLAPLYQRVFVPHSVAGELQQSNTPAAVRTWIAQPPAWFEICPDPPVDPSLAFLGPGERAAIPLAVALRADRLLIDDLLGPERSAPSAFGWSRVQWASSSTLTGPVCSTLSRNSHFSEKPIFIFRTKLSCSRARSCPKGNEIRERDPSFLLYPIARRASHLPWL